MKRTIRDVVEVFLKFKPVFVGKVSVLIGVAVKPLPQFV